MSSLPSTVFLATASGLALKGLISNGFIIAVIIITWAKCGSLTTSEQLLLSLAMCNFSFTALYMIHTFIYFLMPSFITSPIARSMLFLCFFVSLSRYWLTAWLCAFYCIKIVNSAHFIFLWCKLKISWLMPWFLGGTTVISFFLSFVLYKPLQLQSNATTNITSVIRDGEVPFQRAAFLVIGYFSPFLVVLLCCILIVTSLCRHVLQMTGEGTCFSSPQMEAHCKAAGAVLSLLFFYILSYVADIILMTNAFPTIIVLVCFNVLLMYAPAQAVILVLVNPKLKRAAAQVLLRIKLLCSSAT